MFKITELQSMLEGNNYLVLNRLFLFVATFINRSTRKVREEHITSMHTNHKETTYAAVRNVVHLVFGEEELRRVGKTINRFRLVLMKALVERCDYSLDTLKYD